MFYADCIFYIIEVYIHAYVHIIIIKNIYFMLYTYSPAYKYALSSRIYILYFINLGKYHISYFPPQYSLTSVPKLLQNVRPSQYTLPLCIREGMWEWQWSEGG